MIINSQFWLCCSLESKVLIAGKPFMRVWIGGEGGGGGGGGVWNSLISKNLVHYSLSLKFLLIL